MLDRFGIAAFGALTVSALVWAGEPDGTPWCRAPGVGSELGSSDFVRESDAAMARMMTDMETEPSGDVDRDFAARMIPHHQGAIEMAEAELRYGRNEQLRRIAQEIVVEQRQEIAALKLALEPSR